MKSYDASVTIDASLDRVWSVLIDGAGYASWDSGVDKIEGEIGPGEILQVYARVGAGHTFASPGRAFPVKVIEFSPHERMTWSAGLRRGLFKSVRTFTLTREGDRTKLTMCEEFTGPLLPLLWWMIPDLQPSFDQFTRGLKARAEGVAN